MKKRQRKLSEWICRFDRHLEARNFSPMTRRQYENRLLLFGTWAKTKGVSCPQQIKPEILGDYQAFLSECRKPVGGRLAIGTQLQRLAPIKSFCRWLFVRGVLSSDPASELVLPKKESTLPRDVPTPREIGSVLRRLLREEHPHRLRNAAIISMLFATGCRKMELARLRLSDVNLETREVRIEKAKNRCGRLTFIAPWAAKLLELYLQQERPKRRNKSDTLFPSGRTGNAGSEMMVSHIIGVAFAGLRNKHVVCHSLRHAFCLSLLRGGANIRVIAELAGHNALSSTSKYTNLELTDLRKVHEAAFVE